MESAAFLSHRAIASASLFLVDAFINLHLGDFNASVSHFATAAVAIAHVTSQKITAHEASHPPQIIFHVNPHC
jgi:hypothetical protein